MKINQILVPTDFSENAASAMNYAVALAKQCSATLHLLHTPVVPTYLLMDLSYSPGPEAVTRILNDSQEALDAQAKKLSESGVEHFTAIREGTAHEVIRDYAKEHEIDLVIMGSHGRSGLLERLFFDELRVAALFRRLLRCFFGRSLSGYYFSFNGHDITLR